MYPRALEGLMVPMGLLADNDRDDSLVGFDDFRILLRDEASLKKMKEPLYGNGRLRCDPVMRQTLLDLAWFYDYSRIDERPCWDPDALEKMRKPVLGFSHYRLTPATMPFLFALAWFHEGLLEGNSEE